MKRHVLNGAKGILFAALLLWAIHTAYGALKWKDTTGDYLSSVEQLYATGNDLIDVVFVGSSHCYCGIYPPVLWEEYGIAAFDMSVSGQDKDSAYHDLVELYKTQSPAVVYVDLYGLLFDEHQVESNVYRNYLSLRTSGNSIALVNKYIEKEQRNKYIFRFPIIHTRYRELKKKDFVLNVPNSFARGEFFNWSTDGGWIYPGATENKAIGELSEKNLKWLNDLIELAEKNNTEIRFMVLPFAVSSDKQEILNAAEKMLTERNISYRDFNKMLPELGMVLESDFGDANHLNVSGAEKLTAYLGRELSADNSLPDHRGDSRYRQWEDDLRWYQNEKIKQVMTNAYDPYEYVQNLLCFPDGVTVISLEGDFEDASIDYYDVLAPLELDYEDYIAGGKWIYRNGSLQKICDNTEGAGEVYYDLNRYDRIRIGYYGLFDPTNIMIGRNCYQTQGYLTFVTYDAFLEEFVVNKSM